MLGESDSDDSDSDDSDFEIDHRVAGNMFTFYVSSSALSTTKLHGGSKIGKKPNVKRDIVGGSMRLEKDYFAESPVYGDALFKRRYRISRDRFMRIHKVFKDANIMSQGIDALGVPGATLKQKLTAAFRMLAYGTGADAFDEYLRMSESSIMSYLKLFVKHFVCLFEYEYLKALQSKTSSFVVQLLFFPIQFLFCFTGACF